MGGARRWSIRAATVLELDRCRPGAIPSHANLRPVLAVWACLIPRQMYASTMAASNDDESFLRRTFAVALRARTDGNHPFAAVLVSPDGEVLIERENGYLPDRDMTA